MEGGEGRGGEVDAIRRQAREKIALVSTHKGKSRPIPNEWPLQISLKEQINEFWKGKADYPGKAEKIRTTKDQKRIVEAERKKQTVENKRLKCGKLVLSRVLLYLG